MERLVVVQSLKFLRGCQLSNDLCCCLVIYLFFWFVGFVVFVNGEEELILGRGLEINFDNCLLDFGIKFVEVYFFVVFGGIFLCVEYSV